MQGRGIQSAVERPRARTPFRSASRLTSTTSQRRGLRQPFRPTFVELSSCCSFHSTNVSTQSPLPSGVGQQAIQFDVPGAKPDGASRSEFTLTRSGSTLSCRVTHWKLFLLPIPIDKYFNRMATQYEAVMQASKD